MIGYGTPCMFGSGERGKAIGVFIGHKFSLEDFMSTLCISSPRFSAWAFSITWNDTNSFSSSVRNPVSR